MTRAEIIDYYIQLSENKAFQLSQIRKELTEQHIEEEEIKIIVRLVDSEIQRRITKKAHNKKMNEIAFVGIALTTVGAFFTIATYTGLINTGSGFLIVYGPFFAGLSTTAGAFAMKRK